ncbi:MAG: dockerin type I repeat-containing protein [Ruminococcus sp.]|nr:dockerin type I repeat-containing protein [Ruminococcus sp.]
MQYKKIMSIFAAVLTAAYCAVPSAMAVEAVSEETNLTEEFADTEFSTVSVFDEYRDWSQMDTRWSETPMGGTTIRSSGCLLTSLAIMAMHSGSIDSTAMTNMGITSIEQFNPAVLANAYTNANGFSYDGAIASWGTINTIIPNITFGADRYFQNIEKSAVAEELNALMAEGWHIIARVNNGGYHWVYIESVGEDGSITMCDPAFDTHDLYEAYPNGLQGEYWMLKGTNAPHASVEDNAPLKIEIASMPDRTIFQYGEELDLTGGTVTVSGKDEENGSWSETFDMIASDMISVDASAYDALTPGKYEIVVTAEVGENKAEVSFEAEVLHSIGEHYVSTESTLAVYAEQGTDEIIYNLRNGDVINIAKVVDGYGFLASVDISGWVDMKYLKKTEAHLHEKGDINNDGNVDKYDLSLLNSFLQQKEQLPNGVSVLTAVQLYAADVNGDGMTDLNDIREYLTIV